METLFLKILYHSLFFIVTLCILVIGWVVAWKYTISHIPIVREICGLNNDIQEKDLD